MKKRKKKKKHRFGLKKSLKLILPVLLVAFSIYYAIILLQKPASDIIKLNYEIIPIISSHRGIILRHETINNTLNSGVFSAQIEQAERVKNAQLIGKVEVSNFQDAEFEERVSNSYLLDETNLDEEVQDVYAYLLSSLKNNDFITAGYLKEELQSKLERMKKLKNESSQNAFELRQKQYKNVGDASAKVGETINLYSNESGVVSFLIDSLENDVNYNNRYQIDYERLWNSDIDVVDTRSKNLIKGQPVFKIIKPNVWYIAVKVPREDLDLFKLQSNVFLDADDKKVEATIYEIFDANNFGVAILKINHQLSMLFEDRVVDITLIRNEVRGVAIPKTAIVKQNNELGVYIITLANRLKYIPVDVMEDDGDRYIVHEGTIRRKNANDEIEILNTVRNGDLIINHANKHKEGEFIDDVTR